MSSGTCNPSLVHQDTIKKTENDYIKSPIIVNQ